ncbi:MAG TPA: YbaB/EbfC family nucleoid-associated protein [Dehalococcoidia bacterium]|nr:YbaB/EbfC family nucleoid-associated protein [Dehalococcoidia bacterium]
MNRDILSQLGQIQERIAKAQEELESRVAEGTAGGGAVTIKITGGMKVQELHIEPDVVDPSDVSMLEDLVTAAVNEALQQVQGFQMGQISGLAGGLNLGALGIPGLGGAAGGGAPGGPPPALNRAARRQQKR